MYSNYQVNNQLHSNEILPPGSISSLTGVKPFQPDVEPNWDIIPTDELLHLRVYSYSYATQNNIQIGLHQIDDKNQVLNFIIPDNLMCWWDYPRPFNVAFGGRYSGKSYTLADFSLIDSFLFPNANILIAREFAGTVDSTSYELLRMRMEAHNIEHFFHLTNNIAINIVRKSKIRPAGLKYNIDNLKSIPLLVSVNTDEAAGVPLPSWKKMLFTAVRNKGLRIRAVFNPDKFDDAIYQMAVAQNDLYLGDYPNRLLDHQHNFDQGPYINEKAVIVKHNVEPHNHYFSRDPNSKHYMREAILFMENLSPHEYAHTILGELQSDPGLFIHVEGQHWHITDDSIYNTLPYNARIVGGLDYGFSPDPSFFVLTKSWLHPNGQRIFFIEKEAYSTNLGSFEHIDLLAQIPEARGIPIIADTSHQNISKDLRNAGYSITNCKKHAGAPFEGISEMHNAIILIHQRCTETIRQFRSYRRETDKDERPISKIYKHDDHAPDAARYAYEPYWKTQAEMNMSGGFGTPSPMSGVITV